MELEVEIQAIGFVLSCGCESTSPQVSLRICPQSRLGQTRGLKVEEEASPQILFSFLLSDTSGTPDGIGDVSSTEKRKPDLPTGYRKKKSINARQKASSFYNRVWAGLRHITQRGSG